MKKVAWMVMALVASSAVLLNAQSAHADEGPRIVVEGFEANHHRQRHMSLHFSGALMQVSEDGLDPSGSAHLGGMNLSWRWDLVEWGGVEVMFGGFWRADDRFLVNEGRTVVSTSWLWYFARKHHRRFYAITGLAGVETDLSIGNSRYTHSASGLVLGVGLEWLLTKNLTFSVDTRAIMLNSGERDGERLTIEEPEGPNDGVERTPFPAQWYTPAQEYTAVMTNIGVGYRW